MIETNIIKLDGVSSLKYQALFRSAVKGIQHPPEFDRVEVSSSKMLLIPVNGNPHVYFGNIGEIHIFVYESKSGAEYLRACIHAELLYNS